MSQAAYTSGPYTSGQGRSCAGCTLCCKLPAIPEIAKPAQTWCGDCAIGQGCKIYETRPSPCRKFECVYLTSPQLGEHWKPTACHMVIAHQPRVNRIVIHVDDTYPDAWTWEPWYGDIQKMAAAIYPKNGQVLVLGQGVATAVLPDRHKPLGPLSDDKVFVTTEAPGPSGPVYDVSLLAEGDPALDTLRKQAGAVDRTAPAK